MPDVSKSENISQLSQSLEKTLTQNRALFDEMARFTREETLRFAHMQLDHADHAFAHFRERHDLSGLIGAQQEWVKQMTQEYAGLSLRYAEMFHTLAQHVQSHVESAASDLRHQADTVAEDLGQMQSAMVRPHNGVHVEHPHMPAE
ncbi:MAG TPA: hypothetical protein VN723_07365 [Rhizomicrobium sp.]|nr:hypothetical protein [Rhizomicrobium sp.]